MTTVLLAGCGSDSASDVLIAPTGKAEIKVSADIWQMMDGTRATTFDNAAAMQAEGSFTCTAYNAGTTTVNTTDSNVNESQIDWNAGSTSWVFHDGQHHYWPIEGSLDFFAYMPKAGSLPSYFTAGPTYTSATSMQFSAGLTGKNNTGQAGLKEFIWAVAPGQNRAAQGATGVTMNFKHPFAKIIFRVGNDPKDGIAVNSITMDALKTSGTCTFDGTDHTWSGQAGSENLVGKADTPYLLIPYNYASGLHITVNATWSAFDVTETKGADIAAANCNFQAGNSYVFTLTFDGSALIVDTERWAYEQW